MGMSFWADETKPAPRPMRLRVECDGDHELLPPEVAEFDITNTDPRRPAVRAGWKFTGDGLVFAPGCTRKGKE